MPGAPTEPQTPRLDSSQSILEFIHRLLILPAEEHTNLERLLEELSAAFAATTAGLATFPEGVPLCIHPAPIDDSRSIIDDILSFPSSAWERRTGNSASDPGNGQSAQQSCASVCSQAELGNTNGIGALTIPRRAGGSCLFTHLGTPEHGGLLLWLEDESRAHWSDKEAALLVLAGQILTQRLMRDETPAFWAMPLERDIRQQRMDAAARIVRRLAHDFGNILTGILGFSELALMHQAASSPPLHDFLTEICRSARNGAQYIEQLRIFARRQVRVPKSCLRTRVELANVLAELWGEPRTDVQFKLHLPADLPPVAMGVEVLRQVLAIVLENAREAIVGTGVIDVSARTVQVNAWQACKLFGDVRPGTHLEIDVADNGSGLTPEAQRQLFIDPFFSTKPRKRGFGLAMAYGILSAHRGGLELLPRPEGGTLARLIVPVASLAGAAGQ